MRTTFILPFIDSSAGRCLHTYRPRRVAPSPPAQILYRRRSPPAMAENGFGRTPVTIVFTLILSFLGFFAGVTCVTMYYYRRGSRGLDRLERLQQAAGDREANRSRRPVIWDVWADKHPKPASTWNDFLVCLCPPAFHSSAIERNIAIPPQPLNMTYNHDQLSTRVPSSRQNPVPLVRGTGFRSLGGAMSVQLRPRESDDGPHSIPSTTDCNVSVFIAMPTPRKRPPAEFCGEFAIGTTEVVYRHPDRPHP